MFAFGSIDDDEGALDLVPRPTPAFANIANRPRRAVSPSDGVGLLSAVDYLPFKKRPAGQGRLAALGRPGNDDEP
jgi:hypothetical protein